MTADNEFEDIFGPDPLAKSGFTPRKDIDNNRLIEMDHRIMKAMFMKTIDTAAADVLEVLKDYNSLEVCTLLCKLVGATYYPQLMARLVQERFNLQMGRKTTPEGKFIDEGGEGDIMTSGDPEV